MTFPLTITGASVALPGIQTDLGSGLGSVQWVVNGYNACFASFLVLAGSLADVHGRRRVFSWGVTLFFAGSVISALAGDILVLNIARAVAGIGAAAAVTCGAPILTATFHGPARARAFGLLGTMLGGGLAFGPTLGGLLVDTWGWRSVFALPAVVAGVVLVLTPVLPRAAGARGRRVDWLGAVLFTPSLLLLIFMVVRAGDLGVTSPAVLGGVAVVIVMGVAFVSVERRCADPMFDLGLLANARFGSVAVAAGTLMAILVPLLVYLPSYLISVIGLDAGQAGIWMLMLTAPTVLFPPVGAAIARRRPAVLVAGSVAVSGAGTLLLSTIGEDSSAWQVLVPLVLTGVGVGLSTGVLDGLAVSSVRSEQVGSAAGLFNTARLATETVVLAAVGAILAGLSGGRLAGAAFTDALQVVCLALGGFAAAATVAVVILARRADRVGAATA
ncbi:MFS transporter [Phytoactinopolyspora mesophila]|uniref:MFS transporter n=1 Tax=Phytoactinopolyspora mesophila TaxID=2650750 RepID=UPI001C9E33DA|nr:MFS transporter [Phytoactinopolyspora mesophila]